MPKKEIMLPYGSITKIITATIVAINDWIVFKRNNLIDFCSHK
jgi:hypothetical protein